MTKEHSPLEDGEAAHYAFNADLIYNGGNHSSLPKAAESKKRSASLFEIDSASSTVMLIGDVDLDAVASKSNFDSKALFPHGGEKEQGSIAFCDGHATSVFHDKVTDEDRIHWKAKIDD